MLGPSPVFFPHLLLLFLFTSIFCFSSFLLSHGAMRSTEERRTKPFAYPKARDLRSLNDQMRSTSQSMLLNVHPVWRDEKALRKAQDINRRMAEDCTRTNNTDHTWQILKTPGYMESQGPQEFYKSEQQAGHVMSEALMRSTRAADVSLGLQKNAISAWSENAILSGIKCFTSGGTLKI